MITLSILPNEKISTALSLAAELEKAVGNGAMSQADKLSTALLDLAQCERPIRVSDKAWMEFNNKVRLSMPSYTASYLVSPETCSRLHNLIEDKELDDLRRLLETASSSGSHMLQIPMDSE